MMMMESHLQYPGAWVYFFQVITLEATVHLKKKIQFFSENFRVSISVCVLFNQTKMKKVFFPGPLRYIYLYILEI